MRVYLESLGCARNLVDSEVMLGRLSESGWTATPTPDDADVIIINTCSFIEAATDESIDTILELSKYRKSGPCRRLIVAGCLPERFRDDIVSSLPEVDCFLGTGAFDAIVDAVAGSNVAACCLPDPNMGSSQHETTPRVLTTRGMAYLKISDGCNRRCTYCIIPVLRGDQRSRPLASLVAEAEELIGSGVHELVLVAQDTTAWGKDLPDRPTLSSLIERLAEIAESAWIRFLYGHPNSIDEGTIATVARHPNICSYFDIPIQHASDTVLSRMGRHYHRDDLLNLFGLIRVLVPDAVLRTSVMVGFPGETDDDFNQLHDFVKEIRFDHLGVFIYSGADDLPSHSLPDPVPPDIAQARHDQIMSHQQLVSGENLRKFIGRHLNVLVEETAEADLHVGRTEYQAPEVDGVTYIRADPRPDTKSRQVRLNRFAPVRITDALEYDLVGEVEWAI